jgi:MurNAc alpha-1-phosphate uridylyltransferase
MRAMILAAGLGTRMRPLTDRLPKPMLPIAGKPLLQHHIERLAAVGVRDLVINTHWLAEKIEDYFGAGEDFGVHISWSREPRLLETGGGVCAALPVLGASPFLLVNGDVWSDYPLEQLSELTLDDGVDAHLVLVDNPSHNVSGDFCLDARGMIAPQTAGPTATFSGLSLLRPQLFVGMDVPDRPFPLHYALRRAVEKGRVGGELYRGSWCDVGTLERYRQLQSSIAG